MATTAVRDRRSLRKPILIRAHQRSPRFNELCQYTAHGFATDLRSRTAVVVVSGLSRTKHEWPRPRFGTVAPQNRCDKRPHTGETGDGESLPRHTEAPRHRGQNELESQR
jgi:hypothetical protein